MAYTEVYKWKVSGLFRADVNEVVSELGGATKSITPDEVLRIAKSEDSCMHGFFEWDDSIAGYKYRLAQAQTMIRCIVVEKRDTASNTVSEPVRLYEVDSSRTSTYVPTKLIVKIEDEYQQLLRRAKGELAAFRKRYSNIVELEELFNDIDSLLSA